MEGSAPTRGMWFQNVCISLCILASMRAQGIDHCGCWQLAPGHHMAEALARLLLLNAGAEVDDSQHAGPTLQVAVFSTSGGIGTSGQAFLNAPSPSVCCPLESSCKKYNDHFWQCMPDDYQPQPEAPSTHDASCPGSKVSSAS